MEILGWIALGVAVWCLVALGVALLGGRIIANRDRHH